MPFSVGNETGRVAAAVALQLQVDTARVVRPRAELHFAQLVVERKPRDVDLARAEEQAWRHPETTLRATRVATDRMPGGTQRQSPDDDTTTFVGNVLSMSSSALYAQPRHIDNMQLRLIIIVG